jgi:hypothetical protein
VKQVALIRNDFMRRWAFLAENDKLWMESWRRYAQEFEDILVQAFWDVFEEAKKELQPHPAPFARETVMSWCLAAEQQEAPIVGRFWGTWDWEEILPNLEKSAIKEIGDTDLIYRPEPTLSLYSLALLPLRSTKLRQILSAIHPHLILAVKGVLAAENCGTVEEAVQHYPILAGIVDAELTELRGKRGVAEGTAARELLSARLPQLSPSTIDRYFRPKPFRID